ncbi:MULTISPECIES: hypothetical protein [unclassified Streptomyces]|uniref:hypothetical protein n=1 Tax=unclassified Streptomyces TaxID=2593676 RepID=UPI00225901BB|nr:MULTISPECIES: hypothetical protein [unclassified Streptomyces]WSP60367.1 hypothetical protein OG306_01010 [Streptomyces sp. NBC_01241]WSU26766.1 hypothetical protein OG508_38010 [Streptomyces sp. NBC_01108]MCX4799496.1 hypothetical protein [Streptomyces sp. NBC_01242]WSJ41360.1 hypothetical protein OG772_35240 [Streptomyces sp. NBC_01321]WSP67697.1 hypothetical protein OG466_37985 [Streptomyces sp. NBC_01240]
MSDPTVNFLATFAGVGRALFSELEDALEWCDRRAEEQFPGAVVEWREPEGAAGVGTGQSGQQWHRQEPKAGHSIPPLSLGSVVSPPVDAEV